MLTYREIQSSAHPLLRVRGTFLEYLVKRRRATGRHHTSPLKKLLFSPLELSGFDPFLLSQRQEFFQPFSYAQNGSRHQGPWEMTLSKEEDVLRPLDPNIKDVNDWPAFVLTQAKVFRKGGGRYANLLEADENTPLSIVGVFAPLDAHQEDLLLTHDYRKLHISIEDVTRFSFGQESDGEAVIWAAGKSGWYEVLPSPKYHTHYADIAEAITLFYFLVDQRKEVSGQHAKGCDIPTFCKEYQKATDYQVDDDEEALAILDKHHKFLMQQMASKAESMTWSRTHIWDYFVKKFVVFAAQLEGAPPAVLEDVQDAVEVDFEAPAGLRNEEQVDWAKFLQQVLHTTSVNGTMDGRNFNIGRLCKHLHKNTTFRNSGEDAHQTLKASARSLVAWMDEQRVDWSRKPIYGQLKDLVSAGKVLGGLTTPSTKLKKHHQKSVLRPPGRSGGKKRALEAASLAEAEEEEEEVAPSPVVDMQATKRVRVGAPAVQEQTNGSEASTYPDSEASALVRIVQEEREKGGMRGGSFLEDYIRGVR